MIFSTKTRRPLSVHIPGEGATEPIHIGQAVLDFNGTIDYFIQNTFDYPTLPSLQDRRARCPESDDAIV